MQTTTAKLSVLIPIIVPEKPSSLGSGLLSHSKAVLEENKKNGMKWDNFILGLTLKSYERERKL